jgi:hypothetical protein
MKCIVLLIFLIGYPTWVEATDTDNSVSDCTISETGSRAGSITDEEPVWANRRQYMVQNERFSETYVKHLLRISAIGLLFPGVLLIFRDHVYGYPITLSGIVLFICSTATD